MLSKRVLAQEKEKHALLSEFSEVKQTVDAMDARLEELNAEKT